MSPEAVSHVFQSGLSLAVLVLTVIIMPSLLVGLIVSLFQAATQINEQTLSFLPRLLVTLLVLGMAGPWIGKMIVEYATQLYLEIPFMIG